MYAALYAATVSGHSSDAGRMGTPAGLAACLPGACSAGDTSAASAVAAAKLALGLVLALVLGEASGVVS